MRQRLPLTLLVVLAASGSSKGFLFPDDTTEASLITQSSGAGTSAPAPAGGDGSSAQTEDGEEDYDYGPTGEPEEEGVIEERFFFGKRTSAAIGRKLGQAASSLIDTLSGGGEEPVRPPVVRSDYSARPPYGRGYVDPAGATSYPPYQPAPDHGGRRGYPGYEVTPSYTSPAGHRGTQDYPDYGAGPSHSGPPDHRDSQDYPDYDTDPGQTGPSGRGTQDYPGGPDYGAAERHSGRHGYGNAHGGAQGYPAGYTPGYGVQGYNHGQNPAASYGDYGPEPAIDRPVKHKYPVNRAGVIVCGRLPKRMRKACRKARRRQQQGGGIGTGRPRPGGAGHVGGGQVTTTTTTTTPAPITCPQVPEKEAMTKAKESCCGLQKKGDLYGFNKCCETHGFCPMCDVDSEKLAMEECCPILHEGNTLGYRQCCSKYGTCPECGPAPVEGCLFKGQLFPIGSTMERNAAKCLFIYCRDNGAGPETVIETEPRLSGCCTRKNDSRLFLPGTKRPVDECTNLVCEEGEWVTRASEQGGSLASTCPEGFLDLGRTCVFIWRELMTFNNATIACGKLRGSLFLPQNSAQHKHVINAFRGMEDRDQTLELGGWVNAQAQDNQWQTLRGDTLAFAPWERDFPDDKRRTNCAGLTVTEKSEGWKDYMCDNREHMLYPICEVRKPECGEVRHGCGPYDGGLVYEPGTAVSIVSNECESFVCNQQSYVVREVNNECCYHKEWNGRAFGRKRGWYSGLFQPGGFELYDGMLCECHQGLSECTQFFK